MMAKETRTQDIPVITTDIVLATVIAPATVIFTLAIQSLALVSIVKVIPASATTTTTTGIAPYVTALIAIIPTTLILAPYVTLILPIVQATTLNTITTAPSVTIVPPTVPANAKRNIIRTIIALIIVTIGVMPMTIVTPTHFGLLATVKKNA